ncbi:hypothetical protein [Sphingosinicella sp. LY1275]|uniref:hypothetical protein n=1 Tax=Sphingosinicella sp. LY1275 TaxID=3095379 RepID=UPI002ADEE56E|nr:hypothetical protein [Sphingosinicella sp. LY1275]MEA1015328.1 hypothetical protein [Sphingosinicella sp. LY1275]
MAVMLRGAPSRASLEVTGDLEALLALPCGDRGQFYLAFSDGTLVEGHCEDRVYRFRLHTEGAGLTSIRREGACDVIQLGWAVEWVTVASHEGGAWPVQESEPLPLLPGLFEELGRRVLEAAR